MRTLAAEIESTGHNRQHAGSTDVLSSEIGNVRRQNAERDLDGTVIDPILHKVHDLADDQPHQNTYANQVNKT